MGLFMELPLDVRPLSSVDKIDDPPTPFGVVGIRVFFLVYAVCGGRDVFDV